MSYRTRLLRRGVGAASGLIIALVSTLVGAAPASASTWTLEDLDQKICLKPEQGLPRTYVFAHVTGTWSAPITARIENFPAGSSDNGGTTFPPGSNDGSAITGAVPVSIAPAPAGDYIGAVSVTDGTETQSVPVLLRYDDRTNCWE